MAFIKLHRKIIDWEWYNDPNTFRLFIHLLLNANFKANRWKGAEINIGQVVIGRKELAKELKLSEQEIRTSLGKLKSTNEITIKSTNKYSIVTICKWNDYQTKPNDEQPAEQPANQQSINQQSTTLEEVKEEKKIYRRFAHLSITVTEFDKLIEAGYSKNQIDEMIDSVQNYKDNKRYTSLYLTVKKWLKNETPAVNGHNPVQSKHEFDFDSLTAQHVASAQSSIKAQA